MRDRRFIAVHRGGPLDRDSHRALAAWAATCAEHVLPLFESVSNDLRPRRAIEIARAWANDESLRGQVSVGDCQKASVAAHAAARATSHEPAIAAARAAGHAVATAHAADHSLGPALYACKAVALAGGSHDDERAWQIEQLPPQLRPLIFSALEERREFRIRASRPQRSNLG